MEWKVTHSMKEDEGFESLRVRQRWSQQNGWKSRHRKRQWDERNSPCSIPPKGRRLQASFNVRVWTTAWAGWGRIHTSPLTRKAPLHQTGFSSWLELLSTCQATTGKQRGCLNSQLGGIFLMNTLITIKKNHDALQLGACFKSLF